MMLKSGTRQSGTWKWCVAIVVFLMLPAAKGSAGLPADDAIRAACTELVLNYAFHRDRLQARPFAQLFTTDAQLLVLGATFVGRQAIYQRLADTRADDQALSTRHMMSTIRIFAEDNNHATGISYVTLYAAPAAKGIPAEVDGFLIVGEYHDNFVRTADGWKIRRREFVPIFNRQE